MKVYVIVDLGASNGRVIAAKVENGKSEFDIVHRFENVPVLSNENEYFWDILRIFSDVKAGIQKALRKYPEACSVGIDTFGCDFGFIDDKGRLIGNPLFYRDEKQHAMSGKMHEILSEEELFKLSQGPCNRIMGIYKLFALKEIGAFEYEHGAHLLMMPDMLNYLLTGKISNEFTNGTMTLLVDQRTRSWSKEICRRLNLRDDIFTPLSEPGTVLGEIKPSVCKELEIKPIKVVIPATHDTAAAVAGIPATHTDRKWGFISLGSWALAGLERPEPVTDPRIVPLEYGNEGGVMGRTMLLKNLNGMWIIQQCRKRWIQDLGHDISWDEIVEQTKAARQQNCVIDIAEESFGLFQSNMPKLISDFCRETGQDVPETLGEIAQCAYKSLAMKVRDSFESVLDVLGEKMELIQIVGGGTQNHLLCQWIVNALEIPGVCGPTESTAMGNLIFQMKADGQIATLEEGRALCAASNELYELAPQETEKWREEYAHYQQVMKVRKNG